MYSCSSRDRDPVSGHRVIAMLNSAVLELTTALEDIKRRLDVVERTQSSQWLDLKEVLEECASQGEMCIKSTALTDHMEAQLQKLQTWVDQLQAQQAQAAQDRLHCKMTALSAFKVMQEDVTQITCSEVDPEFSEGNLKPEANMQGRSATKSPSPFVKIPHLQGRREYNTDSLNSALLRNDSSSETATPISQL